MADDKKDKVTGPDVHEEEEDRSYTDMFGKWVRDRLATGRSKLKDVE